MKKRIKISVCAIVTGILFLLFLQFFWINRMFCAEQKLIKTQASLLLNDVLSLDLQCASMARYDSIKSKGIEPMPETRGGNFDKKTITVYVAYPESRKIVRKCKTEEEWYEYTKDMYGLYHYTSLDLDRLDSIYKVALLEQDIVLPHVMVLRDSCGVILQQTPPDVDFNQYQLALDTMPLGIDGKDFLVVRFDHSYDGMFRQMRTTVFTSLAIVILLIVILVLVGNTIFYQKKVAEIRNDMVNSIVHDLRNPTTNIENALSRLKSADEDEQRHRDVIRRNVGRIRQMIEKLLVTSSIHEKFSVYPQQVFLGEYVRDIVAQYKEANAKMNIHFSCDKESCVANIDPVHFGNAIRNLIDNSIKYSLGRVLDIDVRCYKEKDSLCVSVSDKGIGIPAEYKPYLFEKDFRVPTEKSVSQHGFGLGLNYVKIIVKAHGGEVKVKSEYKKGSEFIISIPEEKPNNNSL